MEYGVRHLGKDHYPSGKSENVTDEKVFCFECRKECKPNGLNTGFCVFRSGENELDIRCCYDCSAKIEFMRIHATGKATLYLNENWDYNKYDQRRYENVSNWTGILKFKVKYVRFGLHNIARKRIDVWFRIPNDEFVWHGVQYGENTQIVHCKRTKRKEF